MADPIPLSSLSPWQATKDTFQCAKEIWPHIIKALWIPCLFSILAYFIETRLLAYMTKPIILVLILKMLSFYLECYVGVYVIRLLMVKEISPEPVLKPTLKRAHGRFSFYLVVVDIITTLSLVPFTYFLKGGISLGNISSVLIVLTASLLISTAFLLRVQFLSIEAALEKPLNFVLVWKNSGTVWGSYFTASLITNILYYLVIGVIFVGLPVIIWGKEVVMGEALRYTAFLNLFLLFGKILNYILGVFYYKRAFSE